LPFDSTGAVSGSEGIDPSTVQRPPSTTQSQISDFKSHSATLRILDAAANRAREGLRVVEDYVRFILNDAHLSRLLKEVRHELAAALHRLGSDNWHALRDTPGDVGTSISTTTESTRSSTTDVVRASLKRVTEALRSLEEYGKAIDIGAATAIEGLRYRSYTIEKAVLTTLASRHRLTDAWLYLLVTASLCRTDIENVIRGATAGGVDIVQLREKGNWGREQIALAHEARRWTRDAGALLIINDRPDIAVIVEADGVHLGQEDLPVQEARRLVGPDRLIGVSTHSIEQARQAVLDGADYLGVGPVFPSQTKQFASRPGLEFVRQVADEISLPWFAIGGINCQNLPELQNTGASRVAVSHAICSADDPESAARGLRSSLVPLGAS
jgi:thiamine-phosphate pyrophosphorylase